MACDYWGLSRKINLVMAGENVFGITKHHSIVMANLDN